MKRNINIAATNARINLHLLRQATLCVSFDSFPHISSENWRKETIYVIGLRQFLNQFFSLHSLLLLTQQAFGLDANHHKKRGPPLVQAAFFLDYGNPSPFGFRHWPTQMLLRLPCYLVGSSPMINLYISLPTASMRSSPRYVMWPAGYPLTNTLSIGMSERSRV